MTPQKEKGGVYSHLSIQSGNTSTLPKNTQHLIRDVFQHLFEPEYQLSVVLVDDKKSQELNKKYRGKDKPTNVLAFPLDTNGGEIFINKDQASREMDLFAHTYEEHVLYLFIHASLHLKGHRHGDTMDTAETKLMKKFVT